MNFTPEQLNFECSDNLIHTHRKFRRAADRLLDPDYKYKRAARHLKRLMDERHKRH
jgi:hypothetical protein